MGAEQLDFILKSVGGSTTEAYLRGIVAASETEELAGAHTLSLTFQPYDFNNELVIGKYPEDDGTDLPLLQINKWIVVSDRARSETRSFIIRSIRTVHTRQGGIQYEVYCESKSYLLLDQVVRANGTYSNLSADDFLTLILADVTGGFTVGTNDIPTDEWRTVEIQQPTILGALKLLYETWTETVGGYEYHFYPIVNEDGTVDILREDNIGSTVGQSFEFSHAISGVTKDVDASRMANRIFSPGLDNGIRFADNKVWNDPTDSSVLNPGFAEFVRMDGGSLDDDPVAAGSFILLSLKFFIQWVGATGYANIKFSVTIERDDFTWVHEYVDNSPDISYPTTNVTKIYPFYVGDVRDVKRMTITCLSVNTYSGAGVLTNLCSAQRTNLRYELAANVDYVEDATSQSTYGLVEASVDNREHPLAINVIRGWQQYGGASRLWVDSTLSNSGWSGGLNPLFTSIGFNTFTENTDSDYILHGTKSQKIENTGGGQGIYLGSAAAAMMIVGGRSYMVQVNMFIEAGSVTVSVRAGGATLFEIDTEGMGWVTIETDSPVGVDDTGQLQIFIVSSTEHGATWYVDSLFVARATEAVPFYPVNSADDLKQDALALLGLNKAPRALYEVDMLALEEQGSEYSSYQFDVGDSVRVRDREAHIDESLMVIRREANLFNMADRRVTLANRSARLVDLVSIASGTRSLRGS